MSRSVRELTTRFGVKPVSRAALVAAGIGAFVGNAGIAKAAPPAVDEAWRLECDRVKDMQLPAADLTHSTDLEGLADCDPQDLYYSAKTVADWTKAMHCAIAQGDPAVVMMGYANGKGVTRSYDLAIKYACELGGAPAEMSGRIAHLLELKHSSNPDSDFDLCDDITSGLMAGHCAGIAENQSHKLREARLKAITDAWPEQHQTAFAEVLTSFAAYVASSSENEVDLSGTARGAFVIEARSTLNDLFVNDIETFERGEVPRQTEAERQVLDTELNATYRRIMSNERLEKTPLFGTVTREGILHTQRVWLHYRDAFVAFARLRYPAVPVASWQAFLTDRRLSALRAFVE